MEGKFLSKQQRRIPALEMKKTHFSLGNYKSLPESPKVSKQEALNSHFALSSAMRATHFDLGKDKPNFKTEAKSSYKDTNLTGVSPYVQPDVSIDLRKHHYTLGFLKEEKKTKETKETKEIIDKKGQLIDSKFSTSHHFYYGNDKITKESTNHEDFTKKVSAINEKEEGIKLKNELQKSHFLIGSENACFSTTSREDFSYKPTNSQTIKKNPTKENIQLGLDKPCFSSLSHRDYTNKLKNKQVLTAETSKDLRKSHFLLGNDKIEYNLTSSELAGKPSQEFSKKIEDGLLRKTNFVLGNSQKPWKTTYSLTHSDTEPNLAYSTRNRNSDKKSSVLLGSTSIPMISISRNDYKNHLAMVSNNSKHAEYLRKHHFDLGNNKNEYKSVYNRFIQGKSVEKYEKS